MRWIAVLLVALPVAAQAPPFPKAACKQQFADAAAGYKAMRDTREAQAAPLGSGTKGPITTTAVALVAGEKEGRGVVSYSRSRGTGNFTVQASAPFKKETGESVFTTQDQLSGDLVLTTGYSKRWWNLEIDAYGEAVCDACAAKELTLLGCNESVLGGTRAADLLFGRVAASIFGGEVSAGRKKREYFTTAEKADESRVGTAVSVHGGLLFRQSSLYLRLTSKQDFKEGDTVQRCEGLEGGLEKCKALPFGEPARVDTLALAAEGRYFLADVALAPSVAYEFNEKDTTLQVPVFLVRNEKDSFTGGLRFGWTTKDDLGFTAAIFITKPLTP